MSLRRNMPLVLASAVFVLAVSPCGFGRDGGDWRLDLLEDEGVAADTGALREFQEKLEVSTDRLRKEIGRLGADEFTTREDAQKGILRMGRGVLPWLRQMPESGDPEVRVRLAEIERSLQADGRWIKEDLLRHAVRSLLRERSKEGLADSPPDVLFAEFFRRPAPSLAEGYGHFVLVADQGLEGVVSDGLLRLKGNHAGDGAQSLVLKAKELTGRNEFPESFTIDVSLGGEAGGAGGYHVGVSVGNIRALYHPGYASGGFRFERVDDQTHITENAKMGFSPSTDHLQRMSLTVTRHEKSGVRIRVLVIDDGKYYTADTVIDGAAVGTLDRIGLDRSGRSGGDGLFDDLVVDFGNR